jgi:hypothetical protein
MPAAAVGAHWSDPGVIGGVLMLMPFFYVMRKRVPALRSFGSLKTWLELHLFCGIFGPVLVTFHTSFKFNGIVSAAYWAMVIVVLSGFVGRYLYVRIPRSIRGTELSRSELDERAERRARSSPDRWDRMTLERLRIRWAAVPRSSAELSFLDLLFGEITLSRRVRALEGELGRSGLRHELRAEVVALTVERSLLLRRIAYLERTRKLFELWHVFHLPLVTCSGDRGGACGRDAVLGAYRSSGRASAATVLLVSAVGHRVNHAEAQLGSLLSPSLRAHEGTYGARGLPIVRSVVSADGGYRRKCLSCLKPVADRMRAMWAYRDVKEVA